MLGLQTIDVITTYLGLQYGAKEANPFMYHIVTNIFSLVGFKIFLCSMLAYAFLQAKKQGPAHFWGLCVGHHVVMAYVAINNLLVLSNLQM